MIWARTDTSRAETDSSAMMISGFIARARAMQTRWRCPPEKLMRITDGHCGVQIDALQQFPNPAFRFLP